MRDGKGTKQASKRIQKPWRGPSKKAYLLKVSDNLGGDHRVWRNKGSLAGNVPRRCNGVAVDAW